MLLVFPSGGNRGPRNTVTYPSVYEQVIQVAPCNMHGQPSNFAQINPTVEVLAPGGERSANAAKPGYDVEGVFSLGDAGGYTSMSGGCMCSQHTGGVLALIVSRHPEWTAEEVRMVLRNTASGNGWQPGSGHGVINARRALEIDRVAVALQVVARGWRLGATHTIRRDVSHFPITKTAVLDGSPVALQVTITNNGARDLKRAMLFFFAGDPASGGQMIAVRELAVNGLESVTCTVETAVADGLDSFYTVLDPLGAQTFAGLPYTISKGPVAW